MKCPRCGLIVTDEVPRCRGCGFSIADLDERLGDPPARAGFINDYARLLPEAERAALERRLAEIAQALGGEIVLATVATTRPARPSEYVFWLFNRWEVGGERHAGLLILLAEQERRIECEVGYSWEPFLSDAESGEVLDRCVVPLLHEGRIPEGLREAVEQMARLVAPAGASPGGEGE